MRAKLKAILMQRRPLLLARLLRFQSNWNRDLFTFLNVVRRGDTVFDVGANEGLFTEAFARIVGPQGAVYGFEPVPPTFERLARRFPDRARWRQVHLEPVAVGNTTGLVQLHMPGEDSGQASLRVHTDGSWSARNPVQSFTCRCTTLDEFAARQGVQRIDLLKVDVEGAELLVLQGARAILRQQRPILFLEIWDHWMKSFGYQPSDVAACLEDAGYDTLVVVADRIQVIGNLRGDWQPALTSGVHNLLAIASDRFADRFAAIRRRL
ncbi:MAG TPA: FkbM family methyltransferase [Opitutaceae bacterium]|nr:FkbM family methyltransferase [Opitutaceae bacterium]